jgi:2-dehydro-3-deoxyphosphooctonate aldolase (KDO 8-P synthase)
LNKEENVRTISVQNIEIGPGQALALFAGPCVLESETVAFRAAEEISKISAKYGFPLIYKSSFTKDNRSSEESYQGPGLDEGLRLLQKVKEQFSLPIISDVHTPEQAAPAAEVLDIIQIPAYLCMQTSLTMAVAATGKPVNVKKAQFLAAEDMKNVIGKIERQDNYNILLTERGTVHGYHNLVVDFRNLKTMRSLGYPVMFDPTHSIRIYGRPSSDPKGGSPQYIFPLTRAGVAAGIDALFIETHPCVEEALCDAASMLPLHRLDDLLKQVKAIRDTVAEMED